MKKGQASASGAASVIAIIVGFIVLYLLLVNPEAREELLGNNNSEVVSGEAEEVSGNLLLLETPGTIYTVEQNELEHKISSFNLYTKSEDAVLKSVDSAYISTSRSSQNTKKVVLVLESPENTKNVFLSFNAEKHRGRLVILVNDDEVFNSEASGFQQIKLENLQNENIIELKASELGWLSFTTNYYELKDIKITGTVANVASREATNSFYLGSDEAKGVKSAYVSYIVECRGAVGKLSIYLNDALIESKAPDCGSPAKTELDPASLVAGKNTLRFFGETGSYLVDRVSVKTKLKEALYPAYYFEVNATQLKKVEAKDLSCELKMKFVDDRETKRAELNINGHKAMIDTAKAEYAKNINAWLVEGSNYLKITPEKTLQVVEVRVDLK